MTEAQLQVEMYAIPMDAPALRCTTEAMEQGAELLAERQQDADRSEYFGVPCPHVARAAQMRASSGFRATGTPP